MCGINDIKLRRLVETVDINDISDNEDYVPACTTVDTESDMEVDSEDETDDNLTAHGLKWTEPEGEVARDVDDRARMDARILWRDGLDNNRSPYQYYMGLYPTEHLDKRSS